jgi:hypothetical protein
MMKLVATKSALCVALVAVLIGASACGAAHTPQPATPPAVAMTPTPVTNEQFGQAVLQVLKDGSPTPERLSLLAGVVRRQFARAAERFDAGQPERGLDAVKGALYLVRAGELRLEMLDPSSAKALQGAHETVAPRGLEGPTLAFLRLQASALPKDHPDQARIQQHMQALDAWMKDTRQRSDVENASADARTFGERAMLEPSAETLEQAEAMTERWLSASMDFNETFRPGLRRSSRDEMLEAYRALRTGAIIMAGLYLRHGDAAGAAKALERSNARKVTSPELFERLQTAASVDDPGAWRDLAALYSRASSEGEEEELTMPLEIAQGATWGAAVAAYRAEPTLMGTAGPMAMLLATYGMPEGAPHALTPVVKSDPTPEVINVALRVVAGVMLQEDSAHDYASVRRVFDASQNLLAMADAVHVNDKLDPSPARIRGMMAALHQRSGNLASARPMLEQTLKEEPSLPGFISLAALLFQAGDQAGALAALNRGLQAPDASTSPVGRAEAHLLAFLVHRSRGADNDARSSLAASLRDALDARAQARTDIANASADRVLARLAYYFGDKSAWQRAVDRMLSRANLDSRVLSLALIEATSTGLLYGDLRTAHRAFDETASAAEPEDMVYAALWLQLTEQAAKDAGNGMARKALSTVEKSAGWAYHLARYGREEIDDAGLVAKASSVVERAEADFYIAMRKRVAGDQVDDKLASIAAGPAIDLVETHIARELTQSTPPGSWGPAPVPLP